MSACIEIGKTVPTEPPFAAIDELVDTLGELDARGDIILDLSAERALDAVRAWLDAQPNVVAARKFQMRLRHSINTTEN